jgi:hypothetical protein
MGEKEVPALEAFARLQELYISTHGLGGTDRIRDHLKGLGESFDQDLEAIHSVAGSRVWNSDH